MASCADYCTLIQTNCTLANQQYASDAECMTACDAFAPGIPGEQVNDTLACRVYHAGAAGSNPDLHCAHAGPDGGGVCVD